GCSVKSATCPTRTSSEGADHLLLDQGRRSRLGGVALAMDRALEPPVHPREMKRRRKAVSTAAPPQGSSAEEAASPPARSTPTAAASDGQKDARPRRRRGDGSLEDRISYRFADLALLDSALSHISALK